MNAMDCNSKAFYEAVIYIHLVCSEFCFQASLYNTKNETEILNFIFIGSLFVTSYCKSSYGAFLNIALFYMKFNILFPLFLFTI